jgi:phosphoribosyl 1,2-cyclic phosphodiesterase
MNVVVLGSGSRGNAVACIVREHVLFVDAGFGWRELVSRAEAVGIDPGRARGIVLTHEHGDHAAGAAALAREAGCPILASPGTVGALGASLGDLELRPLDSRGTTLGPFSIETCRTSHDAAEPVAVLVGDGTCGASVAVALDVGRATLGLRALLRRATLVVIEANHDPQMLEHGPYPPVVRRRIAGHRGHLSNQDAARLLGEVYDGRLQGVILAHLSEQCNAPRLALAAMRAVLGRRGFRGRVHVARQDRALGPVSVVLPEQLELAVG